MDIQIISASAGSGKTYTLAQRLETEIRNKRTRPDAIIATTFTKKAAAELEERVRMRLFEGGLDTQAQQLSASRIGTVNAVCGKLLTDFSFDLGISPCLKIIEEDEVSEIIRRSMAQAIDRGTSKKLFELEQICPETEPTTAIKELINKARSNGLSAKDLGECEKKSIESFCALLGNPLGTSSQHDQNLKNAIQSFLAGVDISKDTTKTTKKTIESVRRTQSRLAMTNVLPWAEWVRITKGTVGVKSRDIFDVLQTAASAHDNHPHLMEDTCSLISTVFQVAARTLDAYQEYKRKWGVVDFVDQEVQTLNLLDMTKPAQIISESLDLLLVDEFQDTSPIQLAIFLKLAQLSQKSIWVGDQKQAIYGFRDTDPALMDATISAILQDTEPETLKNSWRSRPELVRSTSKIFSLAFSHHGFPKERVELVPAPQIEKMIPAGLGPVYEIWTLDSKNLTTDVHALASTVQDFLADPKNYIRDKKTGEKRLVTADDVAILCRTNATCVAVAEALGQLGLKTAVEKPGLLSCPESILALAGLRLVLDPKDSLARAEISKLTDYSGDYNAWLEKILSEPNANALDLVFLHRLKNAQENFQMAGPVEILDETLELLEIRTHCLAWGNSQTRLANIDSLRALCVRYVDEGQQNGRGISLSGMLTHLEELRQSDKDFRAVVHSSDTINVLTWHKSKGLEWPVTVLFQLSKNISASALGVKVVNDGSFSIDDPLANRGLRYWPNPYGNYTQGTPFHDRLLACDATTVEQEKEEKQTLRLLYVGWTRARDKVILAGRKKFLGQGILNLLRDCNGDPILTEPEGGVAKWADMSLEVITREGSPREPIHKPAQPDHGYKPEGRKEYPPAFVPPSSIQQTGHISFTQEIGDRILLHGKPDMQNLGEAIHTFFGADSVSREKAKRISMADRIRTAWKVSTVIDSESLISASNNLSSWISKTWPDAILHHEYPVSLKQDRGTITSGFIDLLLEFPDGFVIIDHKSFPGSKNESIERAKGFAGQLDTYSQAVQIATGKKVVMCVIHFPISGIICTLSNRRDVDEK